MNNGSKVEVIGGDRLTATMHEASREIGNMDEPLTTIAAKIARDGSSRAPRASGALAGSVRPSYHGGNVATVGSDLPYAGVREYGWPKRNQPAQPYLRPALAAYTPEAVQECQHEAQHALNGVKGA